MTTTGEDIVIVRDLFDKYVRPIDLSKFFDPSYIKARHTQTGPQYIAGWGAFTGTTPQIELEYNHDNVYIFYHFRVTTHLGDTDSFTDYKVTINNKEIIRKEFQ